MLFLRLMFVLILYIFLLLGIEWPVYFNQFQLLTVVQQSEEKILPNEKNKKINKYCTTQFLTIHSPYIVIHPLINIMYIYIYCSDVAIVFNNGVCPHVYDM